MLERQDAVFLVGEDVSWDDASAYAQWAGRQLPTEAQWERAARGGLDGQQYRWGDGFDAAKCANNKTSTEPVGSYPPNGFGLYDMAGNVWQWCRDWYDKDWYAAMPGVNLENTTQGKYRVKRGGSWGSGARDLRGASRDNGRPDLRRDLNIGFRCVEAH